MSMQKIWALGADNASGAQQMGSTQDDTAEQWTAALIDAIPLDSVRIRLVVPSLTVGEVVQ